MASKTHVASIPHKNLDSVAAHSTLSPDTFYAIFGSVFSLTALRSSSSSGSFLFRHFAREVCFSWNSHLSALLVISYSSP